MLCVNAGGAAVEDRRGSRLQHLHSDTSGKRGAGSLGPEDLSLPHTPASGRSNFIQSGHTRRNEECCQDASHDSTLVCPQEPHIGAEGMLGAGLSPEQLRHLQRFSPELSWDQAGTAAPLPSRADRDTIGFFIAKFLKN